MLMDRPIVKFAALYGARSFATSFTEPVSEFYPQPYEPSSYRPLPSTHIYFEVRFRILHLCLDLPWVLFRSKFCTNFLCISDICSTIHATYSTLFANLLSCFNHSFTFRIYLVTTFCIKSSTHPHGSHYNKGTLNILHCTNKNIFWPRTLH